MDHEIRKLVRVDVPHDDMAGVYGWFVTSKAGDRSCVLVGKAISTSVGKRLCDYLDNDWFVDVKKTADSDAKGTVFAEFVIKCLARLCVEQQAELSVFRLGGCLDVCQKDQRAIARSQIAELQAWLDCEPRLQSCPVRIDGRYKRPGGQAWRMNQKEEAETIIRTNLLKDVGF